MAVVKTTENDASVDAFVQAIDDPVRRRDAIAMVAMMKKAARGQPKMWGASIVGFGATHFPYASGREGDIFVIGFSPRKAALTLYFCEELDAQRERLQNLGRQRTGKGCRYIQNLDDVDTKVLDALLRAVVADTRRSPPAQ